ncbi:MAG: endonuclease [bacterium]|nr:endonuclease [bacterium]
MPPVLIFIFLLLPGAVQAGAKNRNWAENPVGFATARKHIYKMYHERGWHRSFYCDCQFNPATHAAAPYSCGFRDPKFAADPTRPFSALAEVVQMEHVVPASVFGPRGLSLNTSFATCQDKKNRRGCYERVSKEFKRMHSNPYNLVPVLGALNNYRQDLVMGPVEGETKGFGECDFEVDRNHKRVEPRPQVRGDVARIYFYMEKTYPEAPIIDPNMRYFYKLWSQQDPVDRAECLRAAEIEARTGMVNGVIQADCKQLVGGK